VNPKERGALIAALVLVWLGKLALRVSPRVGVRLVRWAAGLRYRQDPERAAARAEELAALVKDRPGKLLKLLTGLGFALHALAVAGLRGRPGRLRRLGAAAVRFTSGHRVGLATIVAWVWTMVVSLVGIIVVLALRTKGYAMAGFGVGVGVGMGILIVAGVGGLGLARVMRVGKAGAAEVMLYVGITTSMMTGWMAFNLFGIATRVVIITLNAVVVTTLGDLAKKQDPARETGPGATAKLVGRRARTRAATGHPRGQVRQRAPRWPWRRS
jgi:hypothetical protein